MSSSSACRCIDDYQHGMRARGPSLRPSRSQLWLATALWRAVFFADTLQVALSMTCAALVAHAFDMPWPAAVLAGGAAAMCQAMSAALLPAGPGQAMLVAAALSMGLAPVIIQHNRGIVIRAFRLLKRFAPVRPRSVAR